MKNKLLLGFGSMAVVAAPIAAVVSCGGGSTKPTFYNYDAYMSEDVQNELSDTFTYKTFGDLPEFESYINTQKTVGGIGSDYLNAKLAKSGKIQKIDFTKVFPSLAGKTKAEIATALQSIYTKEAWDLMASFDAYIGDADKDGAADHLYEFMVPYFIQNKAIAFDLTDSMKGATTGHKWTTAEYDKLVSGDQAQINSIFDTNTDNAVSYKEIFTVLKDHGYAKPIVNDYWRDNMMIGSEYSATDMSISGFKTTFADAAEAQTQINGFDSLIRILQPNGAIQMESDGVETLSMLTGGGSYSVSDFDVATLYNGDALDAYLNGEGFNDTEDDYRSHSIGIVKPTNSSYLLDGLVIPSYVSGGELDSMYKVAKDVLFEGADKAGDLAETHLFNNFDYVCYTSPYKNLFDALKTGTKGVVETSGENYFETELGKYISIGMIEGSTIDTAHITQPISDTLQQDAMAKYRSKFPDSAQ